MLVNIRLINRFISLIKEIIIYENIRIQPRFRNIFINHGFKELNSKVGSREFRNRHLFIFFDEGIKITENNRPLYSCKSFTDEQLHFLFLYFKLNNMEKDILFEYFSFKQIMSKGVDIIDHKRRLLKREGDNGRIIKTLARVLLV